jgi:hypothetical protein
MIIMTFSHNSVRIKYVFSYFPKNDPKESFSASKASSIIPEVFSIIPVVLDEVPEVKLLFGVNIGLVILLTLFPLSFTCADA